MYQGKEYVLSNKRIVQKNDKTCDDDYFILSLFAIGKELASRPSRPSRHINKNKTLLIELLVGLPPLHYKSLNKKFKAYFTERDKPIKFSLNGQPFSAIIGDAQVYPQSYAAALTAYEDIKKAPLVSVVDVGGYTVDCIRLERMHTNMDVCTSLYRGVGTLFQKINEHIRASGAQNLRDSVIENILLNDTKSMETYSQARIDLVKDLAQKFAAELLLEVAHTGLDLNEDLTVFVGGGALLLKEYLEKTGIVKKSLFVNDIHANAKGYEIIYYAKKTKS